MKTLLLILAGLTANAQLQTITDTLTNTVGGGAFRGKIVVTLNAPGNAQPLYYQTTSLTGWSFTYCVGVTGSDCSVTSAAGTFVAALYANSSITPAGTSYSARYAPQRGGAYSETWVVGVGHTKLYEIRSTTVPTPSTTFTGGQLRLSQGSILYGSPPGAATELPLGTTGYCLTAGVLAPLWAACSGGGGGTWGSITGTLSSQTDLQAALDAKLSGVGGSGALTAASGLVDINDAYVMCKTCENEVTGTMDLSGASQTAPAKIAASDPPTCDDTKREQYYNTTLGRTRVCNTPNTWSDFTFTGNSGLQTFMTDSSSPVWSGFCRTSGTTTYGLGWVNANGTWLNVADANTLGHVCVARGAVTTGSETQTIYMGDNADKAMVLSENVTMYYVAKASAATDKEYHLGWGNATTFPGTAGCWIYRLAADTVWKVRCRTSSTYGTGTTITGSTVDANWHTFKLRKSGTTVYASFDGGSEFSTTDQVPTATTGAAPQIGHVNTNAGSSLGILYLAKFAMKGSL